jgi:hypothetical protein
VIFADGFLVNAMARDQHAARQIHEACGVPLATLCAWGDHLGVDDTWNDKVNHGSPNRKLNDMEEKLIEEAVNERSARGEKLCRKPVQIVRQITLETRGVLG